MSSRKEFVKLKGSKGQIAHEEAKVEVENDQIGFKCLHYSVTESNGFVEISIIKKVATDLMIGVRTVADTATTPKDYIEFNEVINIKKRDSEYKVKIEIIDDD